MQKIYFTKMHGAGNDFIFIDNRLNPDFALDSNKIQKLCDRRFGIGADGLITIQDLVDFNYKMGYYNADGSTGSLCANGARCSIWFAENTNRLSSGIAKFISNGNQYSGEVISNELIKFNLNNPKNLKLNQTLNILDKPLNYNFINTGSPHVVVNITDPFSSNDSLSLSEYPVIEVGKKIRYANDFNPDGTNVNFIEIVDNIISIRTYERGVENETLACGTGSVAAALIGNITENIDPPITLKTKGGDTLVVNFEVENTEFKNLSLTGPAKIVYEGSIEEKFFI